MMRLLDLFCGGGGAAMGYYRAGFEICGVDIKLQKDYPFAFRCNDAIELLRKMIEQPGKRFYFGDFFLSLNDFAAIHASPPCQAYTFCSVRHIAKGKQYPELIVPVRELLQASGKPFVIENVPTAPLKNKNLVLCGTMFNLRTYRHRCFETSFMMFQPIHKKHSVKTVGLGKIPKDDKTFWTITGRVGNHPKAKEILGVEWMDRTSGQVQEAIPPAYTEYIGEQLMEYLKWQSRAAELQGG